MDARLLRKRSRSADSDEDCKSRKKILIEIEASLPPNLSKNQRKKQMKQRLKEKMKPEWRRMRKEKEKKKKLERKKSKDVLSPTVHPTDTRLLQSMFSPTASQIKIVIDMDYEDLMTEKDIKMLIKQCQRCYSQNRRVDKPVQLYLTSVKGKCRDRFEQSVSGYKQWEIHVKTDGFLDIFKKEDIVFLAAESPNVITELDKDKVYIIGGLVDHNSHKGHCYNQAVKLGIAHAKLPITDYITLNSRTVLAVNHVFEILLQYEQHNDWRKALINAIPQRKIAK